MNIDITKLKSGIQSQIEIDEVYSFSKDILDGTDIMSLDDVNIKGYITSNSVDDYDLDVNVSGVMVLPCSLTLKPVNYRFETKIEGNIDKLLGEINETLKKNQNSIYILPIIWENILMEIPIRVVSDDSANLKLEGEGWKLITESEKRLNPELQKLKDLLK